MGTYNKHKLNDDRQAPNRSEGSTVNMQIELDYQEERGGGGRISQAAAQL